ncbi:MAG: hypothetical protein JWN79_3100 [Gemmatimonadetes bacterium]|jgi:hypothetical protein|nr:hypothetical protein [Gemmatimonadota bacterium]
MPHAVAAHRPLVSWVTGWAAALLAALPLPAQQASGASDPPSDPPACYGFAFGAWSPALNWKAAGHAGTIAEHVAPLAPQNREWAMNDRGRDSLLVLFPAWWPAGVSVVFDHPPRVAGDTVVGRAIAFVADGRLRAPTARARGWVVPCGR